MDRILIKISGESISGKDCIVCNNKIKDLANQLKEISKNYSVGVVIGGGNIWRGAKDSGLDISRPVSDTIGMISTNINAIIVSEVLNSLGVKAKVFSPCKTSELTNNIDFTEINNWLNTKGNIAFFAGGTGNPFFTTDTGAALRAAEINAKWILMGKNGVDGIYSDDPKKNKNAKLFNKLSYKEVLDKQLKVMDLTALAICMENKIKIKVFNANQKDSYIKALKNEIKTTIVE